MTLSVPQDLKKDMDAHPELNWSEIARIAIRAKLDLLNEIDRLASKSKLTQKDADEIADKINNAVAKRLRLK